MKIFLTILLFIISNTAIYIYAILSQSSQFSSGWKILLLPIIFFPLLYLGNVFFSSAFIYSQKIPLSVAVAGILNLAIAVIIFMIGHKIYFHQNIDLKMFLGSLLVITGAILIND
jgi:hypothetical protein